MIATEVLSGGGGSKREKDEVEVSAEQRGRGIDKTRAPRSDD